MVAQGCLRAACTARCGQYVEMLENCEIVFKCDFTNFNEYII